MNLAEYFAKTEGIGVLATADVEGKVDVAVYARPKVVDKETIAFVMRQRVSHQNIRRNPQAAYMFIESIKDNAGVRLYLTELREETNQSVVEQMVKEQPEICPPEDDSNKYLVFFHVDRTRQLVGEEQPE